MFRGFFLLALSFFFCSAAFAGDVDGGAKASDPAPKANMILMFLVPDSKVSLAVESVRIVDGGDAVLAVFYPGRPDDSMGAFLPPGTGRWGDSEVDDEGVRFRNINAKKSDQPSSFFLFYMPRPPRQGDAVVVRYKDLKGVLAPVGVVYEDRFYRLGQIYQSGSGRWTEDVFEMPSDLCSGAESDGGLKGGGGR